MLPDNGNYGRAPRLLNVDIHQETEGWWATAEEEPGWSAAAESYEELQVLMNEAAKTYGYDGWFGFMPPEPVMEISDGE